MLPTCFPWTSTKHENRSLNSLIWTHSNDLFSVAAMGNLSGMNKHLATLEEDFLYHIGMDTINDDFKKMFGDVKVRTMNTFSLQTLISLVFIAALEAILNDLNVLDVTWRKRVTCHLSSTSSSSVIWHSKLTCLSECDSQQWHTVSIKFASY